METLIGIGLWVHPYSVVTILLANQPITAPAIGHIMKLISSISFFLSEHYPTPALSQN
jgi:hypothetical protein